jgi:P27 family predicted phage terminase small subunit
MSNTGPGRPRKPTAAHKRDGTYRPGRHGVRNEPQFGRAALQCPTELDERAKREWRRLAPELQKLGLFTRADRAVFAVYCQGWSDWIELTAELNQMPDVTYTTANGYVGITPLIQTRQKAWTMMKEAATRFGLDPSSRAGLDVTPTVGGKTDEDFFYGKPTLEK